MWFYNIHVFPLISEWEELSVALYQTSHCSFITAKKHTQFYLVEKTLTSYSYFKQDYLFSLISCFSEYLRLTWRIVFAKRATEGWKCSDMAERNMWDKVNSYKNCRLFKKIPQIETEANISSDSQNSGLRNTLYT